MIPIEYVKDNVKNKIRIKFFFLFKRKNKIKFNGNKKIEKFLIDKIDFTSKSKLGTSNLINEPIDIN